MPQISRRMVQLLIVDSDPKVPDDSSLVWQGKTKATDLIDEELWFDEGVNMADDIKKRLDAHNMERQKLKLEAVRLRDLQRKVALLSAREPDFLTEDESHEFAELRQRNGRIDDLQRFAIANPDR